LVAALMLPAPTANASDYYQGNYKVSLNLSAST
jgi:hypothetical protein